MSKKFSFREEIERERKRRKINKNSVRVRKKKNWMDFFVVFLCYY